MILKSYELSIRKGPSDKFVDNKYVFIDDRNVCLINFIPIGAVLFQRSPFKEKRNRDKMD